jgi:hypothetical protein
LSFRIALHLQRKATVQVTSSENKTGENPVDLSGKTPKTGRKYGGVRCFCRAKTAANGKWRVANSKRFLEGSAPALPKIFGASRDAPSRFSPNEFGAQENSSSTTG